MPNVEVPTASGSADAYLARPGNGVGDRPAVLLMPDAFGLRPRIEQMADHIAAEGYVVLAPNLFYRDGRAPLVDLTPLSDPERRDEVIAQLRPHMAALTSSLVVDDVADYLRFLHEQPGVSDAPVALVGYCMGARHALTAAGVLGAQISAVGGFHGGNLATDADDSPHLLAATTKAKLFFGHADNDGSMSPEQQQRLAAALDDAGVDYRAEVFEGAAHGYTMSDTAAFDEAATERHWRELFALLNAVYSR